jgi:cellulose biosynthesis protein BcsQ
VSLDTVVEAPILPEGGPGEGRPYVIVVGNEKGGSGKSTAAMHLIVALAKLDFKLGSIDLDARQQPVALYRQPPRARRRKRRGAGNALAPQRAALGARDPDGIRGRGARPPAP